MPEHPRARRLRRPARGIDMVRLLDTVLLCAIATILIVRTQLWLTNYPQLGGRGLHIAHLLWGGLFMLIALLILLAFVSPAERQVAAVCGGIGFGLFMDELGKFITADNNYFFKPTASLIYCFFVIFFLVIRQLDRHRRYSEQEYLVNAIELVKEAALDTMDEGERRQALALLSRVDQSNPLVPELTRILEGVRAPPTPPPLAVVRAGRRVRAWFFDVVDRPWFPAAVVAIFAIWAVVSLMQIVALLIYQGVDLGSLEVFRLGNDITNDPLGDGERKFIQSANLAASIVATGFTLIGLYRMGKGRRAGAFAMFERALLISIFFTQVFAFVHSQFAAVFGLFIDVLLFIAVRAVLGRELEHEAQQTAGATAGEAPAARAGAPA